MNTSFADGLIKAKKADLNGKLDTFKESKATTIQKVKDSYKEKYGDASVFDVNNNQKVNTDADKAQTPTQQTQMQAGGMEVLANALIKLNSQIANIVETFEKVMEGIKESIYKLSTQDAGQQPTTPKENMNTNNQGAETNTKPNDEDPANKPFEKSKAETDKEKGEGNNITNQNEAKTSSQMDREFLEEYNKKANKADKDTTSAITDAEKLFNQFEAGANV